MPPENNTTDAQPDRGLQFEPGSPSVANVEDVRLPSESKPKPQARTVDDRINALLKVAEEERRRRSGLDQRLDTELAQVKQQLSSLSEQLQVAMGGDDEPPTKRSTQKKASSNDKGEDDQLSTMQAQLNELLEEQQQLRAENARQKAISEVAKREGMPDLHDWADLIPVVAEGDDPYQAQVQAVEAVAERLKRMRDSLKTAQENALHNGSTPGSRPATAEQLAGQDPDFEAFKKAWETLNGPDIGTLSKEDPEEVERLQSLIDDKWAEYGSQVSERATVGWQDGYKMMQDLTRRLAEVESGMNQIATL